MSLHRAAVIAVGIALCISFDVLALADQVSDAQKAVQAVYDKRNAAATARDPKGVLVDCTPDFVYITKEGQKGNLGVLKKRLIPLMSMAQNLKVTTARQTFTLKGREATSTVKTHLECTFVGLDPQKPSKLILDDTSEDVWIKTSKGWMQRRKKSIFDVTKLDGKVVNTTIDLTKDPVPPKSVKLSGQKR